MEAYSLDCPNCGAPLGVRPGDTAVVCAHCGSDIRIRSDRSAIPFFHTSGQHQPMAGIAQPQQEPVVAIEAVRRELDAGRKIVAVKLVREQTGLGLKEALEYVEALERGETPPALPPPAPHQPEVDALEEVRTLALQGNKLAAIKRYRELEDTSLAEAKAAVEALERGESVPVFHAPQAQKEARRVEQVRQRMAHLQPSASAWGCGRIALSTILFGLLILGGCGQFVRATDMHHCAVELITADPTLREVLGSPITVSSILLVMGYSSETDFGGNTDRSAGYFTIARGTEDSAWLYVEAYHASTGFYGVRYNPVPNPDDRQVSYSGQIEECTGGR
jgi:ribosomal protein L7/L12